MTSLVQDKPERPPIAGEFQWPHSISYEAFHTPTNLSSLLPAGLAARQVTSLLSPAECRTIHEIVARQPFQPASLDGRAYRPYHPGLPIGSYRASAFAANLAALLFSRLASGPHPALASRRRMTMWTPTDFQPYNVWRPVGVNPLMRFIRYAPGGQVVPHYDAGIELPDGSRSLMSLVVYLTDTSAADGATTFIADPQAHLEPQQRLYDDWATPASPADITVAVAGLAGSALLFDHRVLHAAPPVSCEKLVMRTDIMFTPVTSP